MKKAIGTVAARNIDAYTIGTIGKPSEALMEMAAYFVAVKVAEVCLTYEHTPRILALAGTGNNGGDAVAAARILSWQGITADICIIGEKEREAFKIQNHIAVASHIRTVRSDDISRYDIIIDGLFGTGLTRNVEGIYAKVIESVNASNATVVSVDIPSGIDASTGKTLGCSVKADHTVTFGYNKIGLMLGDGKDAAGEVTVADIGLYPDAVETQEYAMYFTAEDLARIPKRISSSHKGTYGRTLIIAGSRQYSGAAYLSALAAFRCGSGLVEIYTHKDTAPVIRQLLPEAIVTEYADGEGAAGASSLSQALERADRIVMGPGLSQSDDAVKIVGYVLENGKVPLIIDADALNIIAKMPDDTMKKYADTVIITPHIGEMARLMRLDNSEVSDDMLKAAKRYAASAGVITVLKSARSVIAAPDGRVVINNSGCGAMSKAGAGDVLTGIIAGMLALGLDPLSAASMGVYVHGLAGERACADRGEHALIAGDIASAAGAIVSQI